MVLGRGDAANRLASSAAGVSRGSVAADDPQRQTPAPSVENLRTSCGQRAASRENGRGVGGTDCGAVGGLRLRLASNRLCLAKLLEILEGLPVERIEALDISQNDIGDAAPRALVRSLPQLRSLSLSGCGISPEGIRALALELVTQSAPPSELDKLQAIADGVTGSKAVAVASRPAEHDTLRGPGLQALDLSGCSVDAACADLGAALAGRCCNLTDLDVSFSALGPEAVRHLASGLRLNTTLRSLRFEHCHLREEASVLVEALQDQACLAPLKRLSLARNALPDSAFRSLASLLRGPDGGVGAGLTDLDLSGNAVAGEESSSRAFGSSLLASAAAGPAERWVTPAKGAADSPHAVDLRLNVSGIRPFFDAALGRWDAVPHLLTALRNPACRVVEVVLDQCTFSEVAMPTVARVCLNARSFSLCGQPLGEAFCHCLAEVARGNEQRRTSELHQKGVVSSGNLRLWLRDLRLNDSALQDSGAILLAEALTRLQSIRRDGRDLQVLEVAGNHLTAEAINALGTPLVRNEELQRLVLSRNRLRQLGGERIGDLLCRRVSVAATSSIVSVGIESSNAFTNIVACGVERLEPLELELRHCALTAEGVLQVWAGVLAGYVARVDLAENSIDDTCVAAMRTALRTAVLADTLASEPPAYSSCSSRASVAKPRSPADFTCTNGLKGYGSSAPSSSRPAATTTSCSAISSKMVVLSHVNLQPNPCKSLELLELVEHAAPWQRINLQGVTLDTTNMVQLLHCLGDGRPPKPMNRKPSGTSFDDDRLPEYVLSLSRMAFASRHWQWKVITDAVRYALTPPRVMPPPQRKPQIGTPWRRHGGCGGNLRLELDCSDLIRVCFTVPRSIPQNPSPLPSRSPSLARNARKEIQTRNAQAPPTKAAVANPSLACKARGVTGQALLPAAGAQSHTVCDADESANVSTPLFASSMRDSQADPSANNSQVPLVLSVNSSALSQHGRNAKAGVNDKRQRRPTSAPAGGRVARGITVGGSATDNSGRGNAAPSEAESADSSACCWSVPLSGAGSRRNACVGRSFERSGHPDLDVALVLRQLRGLETLRLTRCKLTDRQLAQLCHSGGSSKWSGVRLLDLRENLLTAACCNALSAVVSGGLEVLTLDSNRLQAQGLHALCAAIKPDSRCALRWLSVADNDIGHPGGAAVASLLSQCGCPLQGLIVSNNPRLTSGDIVDVFRSLGRQDQGGAQRLECLDLSSCGVGILVSPLVQRALLLRSSLVLHLKATPLAEAHHSSMISGSSAALPPDLLQLVLDGRLVL